LKNSFFSGKTVPWILLAVGALGFSILLFSHYHAEVGLVGAVTDSSFETEVLKSPEPVLVDFWATWCGPCRMYGPIVDKMAEEYKGKLKVVRVNVDENPQLSQTFHIQAIPTTLLVEKGKVVNTLVGLISEESLKSELTKAFGSL